MNSSSTDQPPLTRREVLATLAAALALFSGLTHLGVAYSHFSDSFATGALFVVAGLGQLAGAAFGFHRRPRWWLLAQLAFNTGLVVVYAVSRFYPVLHGAPEPVEWIGLLTKMAEMILIGCLVTLLAQPGARASQTTPELTPKAEKP